MVGGVSLGQGSTCPARRGCRLLDPVPLSRLVAARQALQAAADTLSDDLVERLTQGDEPMPADRKQVTEAARGSIATFLAQAAQAAHPADAAQAPAT